MAAQRFLIAGKVQGVFFRASTQQRAQELRLRGWVRNLPDGRVEALIAGAPEALDEMQAWLHEGPAQARVDSVDSLPADAPAEQDFRVLPTARDYS